MVGHNQPKPTAWRGKPAEGPSGQDSLWTCRLPACSAQAGEVGRQVERVRGGAGPVIIGTEYPHS